MIYHLFRRLLFPILHRTLKNVRGLEHLPSGPFLLAANHVDYLDGFFIATAVMFKQPRMVTFLSETNNYWWTGGGTIQIDPANKEESLKLALSTLHSDHVICVFVEGRRNPEHELLQGKTGLARLAVWSQLPVIPVGIQSHPGRTIRESLRALWQRSGRVTVSFGPALQFPEYEQQPITKPMLTEITRRVMIAIGHECNKTYPY